MYFCNLQSGGNVLLQYQLLLDIPPNPEIYGLDEIVLVESQPEITCSADYYISETVTFTWTIGDKMIPSHVQNTVEYDNNTVRFISALDYSFTRKDNSLNVTCSVTVENLVHGKYMAHRTKETNLHCKCKTGALPFRILCLIYYTHY